MTGPELDAPAIAAILIAHGVDFVIVGGYAANIHGAVRPTLDLDACPATDADNLARLAGALRELGGGIRVNDLPEGIPFDTSAEALRGVRMLNLRTPHGDFDLTFEPAATGGFDDLIQRAETHLVGSVEVRVATLEDIIRSKEGAAREKDFRALPELYRLANKQ